MMDDWEDIVREAGEEHPGDLSSEEYHHENNVSVQPEAIPLPQTPQEPVHANDDDHDQLQSSKTGAETERKPEVDAADEEEVCRICFSGVEEEPDLGRLISPCLCRGSMSKVHVTCLNNWRNVSRKSSSYFQCDQCRYSYRIQRAKIAGLAENKLALVSIAITFFITLVIINGLIGNWLLNQARSEDSILGAVFFDGPTHDDLGYGGYHSFSYRDSYLPFEAVGQAVDLAQKVVSDRVSSPRSSKYHKKDDSIMVRVEYEDKYGQTAYRMVRQRKPPTLFKRFTGSMTKAASFIAVGVSMTGIGSFFWLMLSLPFWPLNPVRSGFFRTLRGTRDGRGGISPLGTVLLVLFVLVGLIKSVHMCWKLANRTSKFILKRAERGILEVRT